MPPVKKPKRHLQPHFLKQWRQFKQLTQEQAASRFDISRAQLSKIENSKSPYNQALLEAAADAYSCTVADLLVRNPLDQDAPWSIIENLKKASPERRKLAVDLLDRVLRTGTEG